MTIPVPPRFDHLYTPPSRFVGNPDEWKPPGIYETGVANLPPICCKHEEMAYRYRQIVLRYQEQLALARQHIAAMEAEAQRNAPRWAGRKRSSDEGRTNTVTSPVSPMTVYGT